MNYSGFFLFYHFLKLNISRKYSQRVLVKKIVDDVTFQKNVENFIFCFRFQRKLAKYIFSVYYNDCV